MKVTRKIIKYIVLLVIGIITLFNIYNLVNFKVLKQDLAKINSYAVLEMESESMKPEIKIGDLIFIDTNYEIINPGDIITFKDDNDEFITHRVIMREGNVIVTKGDANTTIDKPIKESSVVGKYIYKLDYIGNISKSLRKPLTFAIVLIFGTLICILLSLDIDDGEEESVIIKPINKKSTNNKAKKKNTKKK